MIQSVEEAIESLTAICENNSPHKTTRKLQEHFIGVGRVESLLVTPPGSRQSQPVETLRLCAGNGACADRHAGEFAHIGARDDVLRFLLGQPRGENPEVQKLNLRQLTMVSDLESLIIARNMGLPDNRVPLGLQGENIVLSSLALSGIPAGSTVVFLAPDGVMRQVRLYVTAPNNPCEIPGNAIRSYYGSGMNIEKKYKEAAKGIRGLTLIVEYSPVDGECILPGDFAAFYKSGV